MSSFIEPSKSLLTCRSIALLHGQQTSNSNALVYLFPDDILIYLNKNKAFSTGITVNIIIQL